MRMYKTITLAVFATVMNNSICMEQMEKEKRDLENKVYLGWTGLSAASFVSKTTFNKMAKKYPKKNEQYVKYARYSRNLGCFAALPFMGLAGIIGILLPLHISRAVDENTGNIIEKGLLLPCNLMVRKPVNIYYEKLKAQRIDAENNA